MVKVMSVVKGASLAAVIAVLGIVGVASTRPDTFHVERTASIQAPPEKIAPFLDDFHQWNQWSPFEKMDPDMKRTFSGAPTGKGAVYEWSGNGHAGSGRMEILSEAPEKITIQLDFTAPMTAHNTALFTLVPHGATTNVTWAMEGPSNMMSKVMTLFMSMDSMVGGQFEEGLGNLKRVSEK